MIFVTVGTQQFPMDRLVGEMDRLAKESLVAEPVFIQRGCSTYIPTSCESTPFMDKAAAQRKTDECALLICHAGVGSILMGLKKSKKVLVVPRLQKYGEHVDDHQAEIARAFSDAGYIMMVEDVADLSAALQRYPEWEPRRFVSNKGNFNRLLISIINSGE